MVKPKGRRSVRWGLVFLLFAIGGGMMAFALWLGSSWVDAVVWQNILISVGATVALAGILAILTPWFFKEVELAAERGAERGESKVEQRLGLRIDELQDQVASYLREQSDRQDGVVEALSDLTSAKSIARAMHEANSIGAIHEGVVTVAASPGIEHRRITFAWGGWGKKVMDADFRSRAIFNGPALLVSVDRFLEEWDFDERVEHVVGELVRRMQKAGTWKGGEELDISYAVRNLQSALKLALQSRRSKDGDGLTGSLIEKVSEDIYITTDGIEIPTRGFTLSQSEISYEASVHISRSEWDHPSIPSCPEFISGLEWRETLRILPEQRLLSLKGQLTADLWIPWGAEPKKEPFPEKGERERDKIVEL